MVQFFGTMMAIAAFAADDGGLRVELAPTTPSVRIGRAMPTVWDVQQMSPQIREGRLRFRVRDDKVELLQFTTDEVVVHETRQRLRFLLPSVQTGATPELAVDITWLDRRGALYELGSQILRVPFTERETAMMLVGEELGGRARSAELDRRLDALKVEHNLGLNAVKNQWTYKWSQASLQTVLTSIPPQEFAADPLAYTPFDVVVVSQSAFRRLRRDQLDALANWVCAGGRLLVEPEGIVDDHHAQFLNRLCGGDPRVLVWQLDERGRILWPIQESVSPLLVAAEFGRVIVMPRVKSEDSFADELERQRRAAHWLWSMRPPVEPDGTVPKANVTSPMMSGGRLIVRPPSYVRSQSPEPSHSQASRLTRELRDVLKPTGVNLVPFSLVAALLGGLVLAIGPGEWFLLGRLRRRSWTWITWPAMTLVVTGVLIGLANAYLRSNDIPTVMTIHDLDAQGRIVRTNRFDLLFKSSSGPHETDVRRGLWSNQQAAVLKAEFAQQSPNSRVFTGRGLNSRARVRGMVQEELVQPRTSVARINGRVPGPYIVEQQIEQWTPELSRVLQIPVEPVAGPIDWTQIDLKSWLKPDAHAHVVPEHVVRQVRKQMGRRALVALHHASGDWCVSDDPAWWIDEMSYRAARQTMFKHSGATRAKSMHRWAQLVWLFTHRGASTGSWTLWGPPLGQPQLADVPVLEPSGSYEWAATIIVREGDNTTIYRQLLGPRVMTADPPEEPTETPQ